MKLLNYIDVLWTLLLLQEMDAAVITGDSVEAGEILESKLIIPVFFASVSFWI